MSKEPKPSTLFGWGDILTKSRLQQVTALTTKCSIYPIFKNKLQFAHKTHKRSQVFHSWIPKSASDRVWTLLEISFENPNHPEITTYRPNFKRKGRGTPGSSALWLETGPAKGHCRGPLGKRNFSNSSSPKSSFSYCLPQWPGTNAACLENLIGVHSLNSRPGSSWMTLGYAN